MLKIIASEKDSKHHRHCEISKISLAKKKSENYSLKNWQSNKSSEDLDELNAIFIAYIASKNFFVPDVEIYL